MNQEQKAVAEHFKKDLDTIHDDWQKLLEKTTIASDPEFLKKVARDIQKLSNDAGKVLAIEELKDKAQLVNFILSTPWGAPFVGETTLLDAACTFKEDNPDSALRHLLSDFVHYGHEMETPIFQVFDEISEEIRLG